MLDESLAHLGVSESDSKRIALSSHRARTEDAAKTCDSPLESHLHEHTRAVGVGQGQRSPGTFEIGQ